MRTISQTAQARHWRKAAESEQDENETLQGNLQLAQLDAVRLEADSAKQREIAAAQLHLLTQTQTQLEEKFRALAADALQANSQMFLDRSREQIQHMVHPVSESLQRFDQQVQGHRTDARRRLCGYHRTSAKSDAAAGPRPPICRPVAKRIAVADPAWALG